MGDLMGGGQPDAEAFEPGEVLSPTFPETRTDACQLVFQFFNGAELTLCENSTVCCVTQNRGLRRDLLEMLICRGARRARVCIRQPTDSTLDGLVRGTPGNGVQGLDGFAITRLRKSTAVCRTPPSWMPREAVVESLKLVFKIRGLLVDRDAFQRGLDAIEYGAWTSRPSLSMRPDQINENYSRALSLAKLFFLPYHLMVLDNTLHGQDGERRDLLIRVLDRVVALPGIKVFLADRLENLPPVWAAGGRVIHVAGGQEDFRFDEVSAHA